MFDDQAKFRSGPALGGLVGGPYFVLEPLHQRCADYLSIIYTVFEQYYLIEVRLFMYIYRCRIHERHILFWLLLEALVSSCKTWNNNSLNIGLLNTRFHDFDIKWPRSSHPRRQLCMVSDCIVRVWVDQNAATKSISIKNRMSRPRRENRWRTINK